jgi:hypothetical protein
VRRSTVMEGERRLYLYSTIAAQGVRLVAVKLTEARCPCRCRLIAVVVCHRENHRHLPKEDLRRSSPSSDWPLAQPRPACMSSIRATPPDSNVVLHFQICSMPSRADIAALPPSSQHLLFARGGVKSQLKMTPCHACRALSRIISVGARGGIEELG